MSTRLLKLCDYYDVNALLITALRGFSASQCALKYEEAQRYRCKSVYILLKDVLRLQLVNIMIFINTIMNLLIKCL